MACNGRCYKAAGTMGGFLAGQSTSQYKEVQGCSNLPSSHDPITVNEPSRAVFVLRTVIQYTISTGMKFLLVINALFK